MIFALLHYLGVSPFTVIHWFLAIAITLLIIDAFAQIEIPSIIAFFLFADYCNILFCHFIPIQWYFVSYFIFLVVSFSLYLLIWKRIVLSFMQRTLMRNAVDEGFQPVGGEVGKYRKIDGEEFVYWNGELWQVLHSQEVSFNDGDNVTIIKNKNGKLIIK